MFKKLLFTVTLCLMAGSLMAWPVAVGDQTFAATSTFEQEQDQSILIGFRYTHGSAILSTGFVFPVGGAFYGYLNGDLGTYGGTAAAQLVYTLTPKNSSYWIGFLGSPLNTEIQDVSGDNIDPMTYIVGATGILAGYAFDEFGIWASYKYTIPYKTETEYEQKSLWAVGVYWNL